MNGQSSVLAGGVPWPPSVDDFYLPGYFYPWITKFTVMVWIAVAIILIFFLVSYRKPKLVPTKTQWLAESVYGFGRNGIAGDVIGPEGIRFAPYVVTLLSFIGVMNLMSIVPFFQIAPTAHIAFPAALALISWVLYIYVGIRKHGAGRYFRNMTMPAGAPLWLMPLLIPLEFLSNFIVRPFTLSVRLFANLFAGHFILLVFTLGGFVLFQSGTILYKPIGVLSWAMDIVLTFLELLVALLQAYVFAILNAVYLQTSLTEEH
ncbi:F0F1 ATP synthase subunit A [Rugosimonospora africana]|uniref:ATP synthase subunit a n=1 Tax=Rugosimonospora africana TaxID=556532 RepID=A0A8J3VNR5_9ACTN|nr:F0F1 ATP synthase subunit A [Rugosimonospora africana]GIH13464.1 ATP synthase subunit a [Rugosimonospora africana]